LQKVSGVLQRHRKGGRMNPIDDKRRERAIQNRMNPIRGLKPEKLAQILDQFKKGDLRPAALLWDAMIRRDLLVRNVVSKRCKAVARAQWEILTVDDSPEALAHKRVLEKVYNNIVVTNALDGNERGGMGLLLRLMMMAQGTRYAAFDLVWKIVQGSGRLIGSQQRRKDKGSRLKAKGGEEGISTEGNEGNEEGTFLTAELTYCPLEFFENRTGRLRFLRNDFDFYGEEMKPGEWLVAVGDGIMEATSVAYCYKHLALKDWVACSEAFGTPIPWIQTDAALNSPEWRSLEVMGAQMMAQRVLVTSTTDQVKLIEMAGAANLPFPPLVESMDRAIASLWRGADLSTISQGQASVGASLQGDEADLLLEDDAKWLAEILWDQIDLPALKYALPGVEEALAYVSILPPKRKNVEQDIKIDEFLINSGFESSKDDAAERYGRALAEPGDPILEPQISQISADLGNGNSARSASGATLENSAASGVLQLRQAKQKLMLPILQQLRVIDGLEGEEKTHALLALQAELPLLRTRLENEAASGEVADVLMEEMKRALLEGFRKKETR
jgi:phage gp29-like protein